MNTPDTEWRERLWEQVEVAPSGAEVLNCYPESVVTIIEQALTSHTTYWKERVRKEVEGLQERFGDWDNGDENEPLLLKCEVLGILDNLK